MTDIELNTLFEQTDAMLGIFNSILPMTNEGFDINRVKFTYEKLLEYSVPEKKDKFLAWMDQNEFWKTPASTRFHGNWEGGLCVHTLQVIVQCLKFTRPLLSDFFKSPHASSYTITASDILISALAHDFCKSASYEINYRNTKDYTGNWIKKPYYKTKDANRNLGHGNESVLRLLEIDSSFIQNRTLIEAVSRHMGFSDLSDLELMNYSNFLENPLVLLLQTADQTAAAWFGN